MKPTQRPRTVSEYISQAPREGRTKLREMRACVRAAAKGAKEEIKWGQCAVSYERILVMYGAFKRHVGFYPTPAVLKAYAKDLKGFEKAKGSVQFPYDRPLPKALIKRMVAYRVKESKGKDARWM